MARCINKVAVFHHVNRYGEDNPSNCLHLCKPCHDKTRSMGNERDPKKGEKVEFSEGTKKKVRERSRGRCECTLSGCGHPTA